MLAINKHLFQKWNEQSIKYCHWKSNEHLSAGLDGDTDLDVLLSESDGPRASSILKDLLFVHCHPQFASRYPGVEDWIGFDEETGKLVHLHLHYAIVTGHTGIKEYCLPWTEEALLSRIQDSQTGVYIMNPNLELVTLYTRLILKSDKRALMTAKKGQYVIDDHFYKEISYIKKQQIDWGVVEDIVKRYFEGFSGDFLDIVKKQTLDSNKYLHLSDIVVSQMKEYSRYHGLPLVFRKAYYPIVKRIRTYLTRKFNKLFITKKIASPERGFSIAFIGQDGSGKSTVTSDIQKWLTWKLDAHRFYLGSGDYVGLMRRLLFKGAKIANRPQKVETSDMVRLEGTTNSVRKNKGLRAFVVSILTAQEYINIARRAYKVAKTAEIYRRKGGIVLYDRFPQIQFEGIYDGPKIHDYCKNAGYENTVLKMMAKIEINYLRKIQKWQPDLVFKLLLPPEESKRRRPSDNLDYLQKKHDITKQLQFDGSQIYTIDATQKYESEILQIKEIIWSKILCDQ